jgi:hypothetical protein
MTKGRPARYDEGWMEFCAHSKVRRGPEVDYNLGLASVMLALCGPI